MDWINLAQGTSGGLFEYRTETSRFIERGEFIN
jgi:hypothetical protein